MLLSIVFLSFMACKSDNNKSSDPINAAENPSAVNAEVPGISGEDAFNVIHSGTIKLLDVRTHEELIEDPRIPGSRNFDFRKSDFRDNLKKLDMNEAYLVYCRSGGRSLEACQIMQEMGFKRVYNLEGGYEQYKTQGFLDY